MAVTNWKDYIGKRCLVTKNYAHAFHEVLVLEVSPSGQRVKLQWESGSKVWDDANGPRLVEVLSDKQEICSPQHWMTKGKV
jgi:hypothetical protein